MPDAVTDNRSEWERDVPAEARSKTLSLVMQETTRDSLAARRSPPSGNGGCVNTKRAITFDGIRTTTGETARAAIFGYFELFDNRQRLHQLAGYPTPVEFSGSAIKVALD